LSSSDIQVVVLDLEKVDALGAKAAEAVKCFGRVDVLVNNGGISTRGMGREAGLEIDLKVCNTDFLSCVALTKGVLPSMISNKEGLIINISSVAGKTGLPLRTAYCGAKHGLIGWFDALRAEEVAQGSGVKVVNVCPGSTQTEVSKNALKADGSKFGTTDPNIASGLKVEKCCRLIINAGHAGIDEVWVAPRKEIWVLFVSQYLPSVGKALTKKMAKNYVAHTLDQKKQQ